MSIFETLSKINVNQFTEKKNNLTYLPWAYAWGTLKGLYPASFYAVAENKDGWNYFTDGRTCWVKCCVTAVDGDDHQTAVEYLPVMDYRNNAIPADQVTSTAVNKAIQRCLTKAIARLGLGLYIYAGEDLPEDLDTSTEKQPAIVAYKPVKPAQPVKPPVIVINTSIPADEPPKEPNSRTSIVHEVCSRLSITEEQFGMCKKMAVWSNVIPDVKITALSEEEFAVLLDYVERNYELSA